MSRAIPPSEKLGFFWPITVPCPSGARRHTNHTTEGCVVGTYPWSQVTKSAVNGNAPHHVMALVGFEPPQVGGLICNPFTSLQNPLLGQTI